jgi:hypothetical protein
MPGRDIKSIDHPNFRCEANIPVTQDECVETFALIARAAIPACLSLRWLYSQTGQ